MPEETITIKVWSDSNANIHSRANHDMEVDRGEWEGMNEQERSEYVLQFLWDVEGLSYGWGDEGEEDE